MKLLLGIVGLSLLLVVLAREFLALGHLRRAGIAEKADFARFRRRFLGVTLAATLLTMLLAETTVDAVVGTDVDGRRIMLVYYGLCFILVLWVLLVAVRDFRITLTGAMDENRRITVESLEEVNRTIRRAKGLPPEEEDRPIAPGVTLLTEDQGDLGTGVPPSKDATTDVPQKIRSRDGRKRRPKE